MADLKEQRKHTQLALDQNTKLMEMLANSGLGGEATDLTRDRGKKKKAERTCKNCKKSGYHEDDECFTLEKKRKQAPYMVCEDPKIGWNGVATSYF